jgi:hypothetical protein
MTVDKKITTTLIALLLFFSSAGYCSMFSKNKTRFDWLASASAPRNYPMKIISGTFYYHNDKGGLYIPEVSSINAGWGVSSGVHVVGEEFKALPDRLDIRFFSYAENKMYHGSFDLPYEKILMLFKEGVAQDKDNPRFQKIVAGIAPGGAVAVWAMGSETREVFFGKADAYEGTLTDSLNNTVDEGEEREDYVNRALQDCLTPEQITDIKKNGIPFGLWDRYRKQYHWQPTFVQEQRPKYVDTVFYTGENYKIYFPLEETITKGTQPVPGNISFGYFFKEKAWEMFFTIHLDEAEIFSAFEKLGDSEMIYIESDPKLPKGLTTLRVFNNKQSIALKKFRIEGA